MYIDQGRVTWVSSMRGVPVEYMWSLMNEKIGIARHSEIESV